MKSIKEIADRADMIVNGYAFTRENNLIKVLNINNVDKALVMTEAGKVLETTMDDIEIQIVVDYWEFTSRGILPPYKLQGQKENESLWDVCDKYANELYKKSEA